MALKILFVTPELAPWVKTGGLGDIAASLPPALCRLGLDLHVLTPCYPALREAFPDAPVIAYLQKLGGLYPDVTIRSAAAPDGTPLLLIDCPEYYARPGNPYLDPQRNDWPDNHLRFGLLSRIAAWFGSGECALDWHCDVIHCNDWQTGLTPTYLHYLTSARAKTVMTIHNLAFQGLFPRTALQELDLPQNSWSMDGVEFYGHLSFLKAGLQHADAITTVSPNYAKEILTDETGMGLAGLLRHRKDSLFGILNGIDTLEWNPAADKRIAVRYDSDSLDDKTGNKAALRKEFGLVADDRIPLLGVVSRLTQQKGLDLLPLIADALAALPAQLALLGSGDPRQEQDFIALTKAYPGRFAVHLGFDEGLAHRIEAGADIFLMPSRFEPCGLSQMHSLRYGTPPIVRATGGLADTVADCNDASLKSGTANGFVFQDATADALLATIRRAVTVWHSPRRWRQLQRNGMACNFGWDKPAQEYVNLYTALARRA